MVVNNNANQREMLQAKDFHLCNDKGDLKGFQTNFETLFLQVLQVLQVLKVLQVLVTI